MSHTPNFVSVTAWHLFPRGQFLENDAVPLPGVRGHQGGLRHVLDPTLHRHRAGGHLNIQWLLLEGQQLGA